MGKGVATKTMTGKRQVSGVTNATADDTPKSKKKTDRRFRKSCRKSRSKAKKSKSNYVKKTGVHFNEQEDI